MLIVMEFAIFMIRDVDVSVGNDYADYDQSDGGKDNVL